LITVLICQNALSKIHALYEEANRALEYKMPFNKGDLLATIILVVEILEMHFEKNDNFPGFASQLESSYSWTKIKGLKQSVKL
jgi:hypothetical protein